jgi:hypothetical protein
MLQAKQSKYIVIGNRPIVSFDEMPTTFNITGPETYEWKFDLPDWFKNNGNDRKIVKIYGGSVLMHRQILTIVSEGDHIKKDIHFENLLHATIHSNIAEFANVGSNINTIAELGTADHSALISAYKNYVMVANNFFTPKIYEIPDTTTRTLTFIFHDKEGKPIPLFHIEQNYLDDPLSISINQLVFKIEGELMIA